jgi:hypothetical protein
LEQDAIIVALGVDNHHIDFLNLMLLEKGGGGEAGDLDFTDEAADVAA